MRRVLLTGHHPNDAVMLSTSSRREATRSAEVDPGKAPLRSSTQAWSAAPKAASTFAQYSPRRTADSSRIPLPFGETACSKAFARFLGGCPRRFTTSTVLGGL